MTEKDKDLIRRANCMHFSEWMYVDDLEKEAETDEARRELSNIRKRMFHREEYAAGVY